MREGAGSTNQPQESEKRDLLGLDPAALEQALLDFGIDAKQARMRRGQLWQWIYCHGKTDFEAMTTLSKGLRGDFAQSFEVSRPEVVTEQVSTDGTRKWLLRLPTVSKAAIRPEVEMVYIPEKDRGTLCISSQVGCTLNCSFCHTGTQKLVRNLSRAEIVGQVMLARSLLGDWPGLERDEGAILPKAERLITNVVFMGMGEPLYNYDEVVAAVNLLTKQDGLGLSRRRVTVSTAGVAPLIPSLGEATDCALAISLHAVHDDLRNTLVPLNKKYPLEALLEACRSYPNLSNVRRITFEYVMLDGINDTEADAYKLVKLLQDIPAKINLIPFNPWPGTDYRCSPGPRIEAFADLVNRAGYASPIRRPRGRDIFAACGQLKSESERLSARQRMIAAEA